MITDTLLVVGPGGIGKSPLDKALKAEVGRIDPYRLRKAGPRDAKDIFYAHPRLRDELYLTYQRLGISLSCLSDAVHWFPAANTLFLRVRDEWQLLMLEALPAGIAKAEIFAPAIPTMFENPQVRRWFGRVSMIILNPVGPLAALPDLSSIKTATEINCQKRGDTSPSIQKRVASIDEEAGAWRQMIALGATEFDNWGFAEYVFREKGEKATLVQARNTLLERCPSLEVFFKTEEEILLGL